MWPTNDLTEKLGISLPIIQAPMAGAGSVELALAACNAGALGSLGLGTTSVGAAHEQTKSLLQATNRPFNLNFFTHDAPNEVEAGAKAMQERLAPLFEEKGLGAPPPPEIGYGTFTDDHVSFIEEVGPRIVSFHFGLPEATLFNRVRNTGATILCSATTVAEAKWLEDQSVDVIIAQGTEAGGHRGTFLGATPGQQAGTMALVPQIVDAVDLPVIAAGGISDARGIAAAFMLGAKAVQMGTAFLLTPESTIQPGHRARLASSSEDQSIITTLFSGKPARSLRNRMTDEFADMEKNPAPYPCQLTYSRALAAGSPDEEKSDFLSLWSGQAGPMAKAMPAGELIAELAEETARLLSRKA